MEFVDTHCHIHFPDYPLDPEEVIADATKAGVTRLICVGCTLADSKLAVQFAAAHKNIWAAIGLHPHQASQYVNDDLKLQKFGNLTQENGRDKIVAIGEIGLDYHYLHSPKADQQKLLRFQLDMAVEHNLPVIFHVRQAFDDFWQIYDEYSARQPIRGVVHSFSAGTKELEQILQRDLYVGLNGIMTFTTDQNQLKAAKMMPLNRLLLETDAPFLTPTPYRGTICQPKHVVETAKFLSELRNEPLYELATITSQNAKQLFNL